MSSEEDKKIREAIESIAEPEEQLRKQQEEIAKDYPTVLPDGTEIYAPYWEKGKLSHERKFISKTIQSWLNKYNWEGHYDILFELMTLKADHYRLSQIHPSSSMAIYIEAQKQKIITNKAISDKEKQIGMALGQLREEREEKLNVLQKINEISKKTQQYITEHLTKVEICPVCGTVLLGVSIMGAILHPFMRHITDRVWSEPVQRFVEQGILTVFQASEILECSPKGFIEEAKRRDCSLGVILKLETQLKDRLKIDS